MSDTKIISFNSFKGGSGRSLALANIAYILSKKYKVGCIDFDMEAPGLPVLFKTDGTRRGSIQDFLLGDRDWKYYHKKDKPNFEAREQFNEKLAIDVFKIPKNHEMFQNHKGELYLIRSAFDARITSLVDSGVTLFAGFARLIKCYSKFLSLDYILVDSRSGISEFSLPSLAFCNIALIFFRLGLQHRTGTIRLLDWYYDWLKKAGEKKHLFVVPSTIPDDHACQVECERFQKNLSKRYEIENLGILNRLPELRSMIAKDEILSERDHSDESSDLKKGYEMIADNIIGL